MSAYLSALMLFLALSLCFELLWCLANKVYKLVGLSTLKTMKVSRFKFCFVVLTPFR